MPGVSTASHAAGRVLSAPSCLLPLVRFVETRLRDVSDGRMRDGAVIVWCLTMQNGCWHIVLCGGWLASLPSWLPLSAPRRASAGAVSVDTERSRWRRGRSGRYWREERSCASAAEWGTANGEWPAGSRQMAAPLRGGDQMSMVSTSTTSLSSSARTLSTSVSLIAAPSRALTVWPSISTEPTAGTR